MVEGAGAGADAARHWETSLAAAADEVEDDEQEHDWSELRTMSVKWSRAVEHALENREQHYHHHSRYSANIPGELEVLGVDGWVASSHEDASVGAVNDVDGGVHRVAAHHNQ